jgi:hypothetical protein
MTERNHVFSAHEIVGKTIEAVEEGYEDTRIVCEDGTVYSINTYQGNPRDI